MLIGNSLDVVVVVAGSLGANRGRGRGDAQAAWTTTINARTTVVPGFEIACGTSTT